MKRNILLTLLLGILPMSMVAQDDDMYFVPTKKKVEPAKTRYAAPRETYYSGINRSVDEYNRRPGTGRSHFEVVGDSVGNDIIDFNGELGHYPDSVLAQQDFGLTREMSRWDGYEPADNYWEGYSDGRRDEQWRSWHSPWYFSASYYPWYSGWYGGWYDPWYDPWYTGWYDPWYYGYYHPWHYGYGWYGYYPHYWGGYYSSYSGPTGTQRHGRINYNGPRGSHNGRTSTYSAGTFGGRRAVGGSMGSRSLGSRSLGTRSTTTGGVNRRGVTTNAYGNFGGSRPSSSSSGSTRTYTPSRSTSSGSSSGSFGGGSTFGGSRSSGGGFGGGGGSFGGSRSGGGSFGGGRRH